MMRTVMQRKCTARCSVWINTMWQTEVTTWCCSVVINFYIIQPVREEKTTWWKIKPNLTFRQFLSGCCRWSWRVNELKRCNDTVLHNSTGSAAADQLLRPHAAHKLSTEHQTSPPTFYDSQVNRRGCWEDFPSWATCFCHLAACVA